MVKASSELLDDTGQIIDFSEHYFRVENKEYADYFCYIINSTRFAQTINLSFNTIDIHEEYLRQIIDCLANHIGSKEIILDNCFTNGNRHSVVQIAGLISNKENLEYIDLSYNDLSVNNDTFFSFGEAIKNSKNLKTLRLECNNLGNKSNLVKTLAKAFQHNKSIINLDLTSNNLGDLDISDIKNLTDSIKANKTLENLVLSDNQIGSDIEKAKLFFDAIKDNKSLKTINLSYNGIGESDANRLNVKKVFASNVAKCFAMQRDLTFKIDGDVFNTSDTNSINSIKSEHLRVFIRGAVDQCEYMGSVQKGENLARNGGCYFG